MEKIVLWGCGFIGRTAYEELKKSFDIVAFGDNDVFKQNLIYKKIPIISFVELKSTYKDCKVVITIADYYEEAKKIDANNIQILGYYDLIQKKILPWRRISWEDIKNRKNIRLYAGDIYENFDKYPDDSVICLSLMNSNYRSIRHDITEKYPLASDSIESYQIEDVLEHIEKDNAIRILDEIYRILKKEGYLRLSLPDYHSPFVLSNTYVDHMGKVIFDPLGGGEFIRGKVKKGGHMWFPTYELISEILEKSKFRNYMFLRYYDNGGIVHRREIDYTKGYISRTKENYSGNEDISIVIDCYK